MPIRRMNQSNYAAEPEAYAPPQAAMPYGYDQMPSPYDMGGVGSYGGYDPTTGDPYEQMKQQRNFIYDRGNAINQGIYNDIGFRRGNELAYGGRMNQAADELRQTPGYTPEEQAGIMREGDLSGLANIDYGSNFLSEGERSDIAGNPYQSYRPDYLESMNSDAAGNIANSLGQQQQQLGTNLGQTREAMGAAISPDLRMSNEYTRNQDAVLNATAGAVNSAAGRAGLQMSGEYGRQAGMSDEEVNRMAEQGARTIGNRYRSAIGDLERNAAASGNASPLAVAAGRARLERQSAVDAADAQVDARLAARAAQREAATGVENTRLSTERDISNRGMQAGFGLGEMAGQAVQGRENTRLGSARDISGRQMEAAATTGAMGQNAALQHGAASINAQQQIANRGQQTGQFNTTAGQAAEGQAASRAAYLAGNRQQTNQANQANQFGRGFQVNQALSGRAADVATQRIAGRNAYLGWSTGQTNTNANLGTQARGQQIQNYGTQASAGNQANSIYGNYDAQRRGLGFGNAFKQGFGGSLGKVIGGAPGYGYGG